MTVTDTLGVSGSATTTVSVANVAPLYSPGPNQSTFAGASKAFSLGSFTDPGAEESWSVSIDWGDSTPATDFVVTSVGSLLTRQHSYASPGAYNVALTLDDGEDEVSGGFQVVVNPAPPGTPQVTAPADQAAAAGMAKNFALGSFADPGSAGPWSVSVDWGDNSASTQFSVTSAGALPTRSHTYVATGSYDVVVTVNDGSLSGSASFIINVSGVVEAEQLFLPVLRRP